MRRTSGSDVRQISLTLEGQRYNVPPATLAWIEKQLAPYRVTQEVDDGGMSLEEFFGADHARRAQWALNLRGLRYREDMTQVEFAERIGVSQSNLSAMENGRRSVGKAVARRVAEEFDIDYRLFL